MWCDFGEPIVYMAGLRAPGHREPKLRPRFAHIIPTVKPKLLQQITAPQSTVNVQQMTPA